ncbi:MAG: helicase-exonuclease AddAB subunit AddB [Anaerocolumna aminovalerica]|jgi:ATP-dependent helicase/nuclease subunit B|uniref:helicase-exonuclease AddAB subunit AddB n=1 Tax=Anaerocolumna aminovalerica TaxID=1527 RepID=UPI0029101082|nr:helicase-exonuclease AddAB subunit AddB [Anaerocolumna aminovalerica]MDU6263468.1 helicase-exonuclease AddAB subunit AddB [Anaerocolumna aminovalerica]
MSLQLILGSSGAGKSYQLYKEVISKSMDNPDTNYLVIVPEQFTLQTQKDIVSMHPNRGTMNIDILSFLRLAYRIFDEVGGNDVPVLEDTGKSMVLRKIVANKKKELELFNHDVQKQGFIDELKSLISEIYQYSIGVEQLQEMEELAKNKPMLRAKLHDIVIIYNGFKEYMNEKYITAEEILEVLCNVIDQSQIIPNSIICLDGFTGFTPAQYKLLTILMKKAKKVLITVTIDPREDIRRVDEEFKLFHLSKKTIKRLMDMAKEEEIEVDKPIYGEGLSSKIPYRYLNCPPLAALERNIFRYPNVSYDKEQDSIRIHAARDGKKEIGYVIREIKHLIRTEDYRYQDIALITGDIAGYGRIAEQEFEKAGIPCFIDRKKDILSNPFVEFIRSVLDIAKNDFDYESVFRYLRCGMGSIDREEADILENYVIALGIRGRKRWNTQWTRTYRGQKEGELNRINELRKQLCEELMPLYEVLSDRSKNVTEYTTALYEFGVKMDAVGKLESYRVYFEEQNMLSTAKEYQQIYGIVIELYEKLVELLGEEKLSLKEYTEVLEAGLAEAKVGLIPPGLDQVVIGDIERTRLKDIKALFFVGVNDGIIPKSNTGGGILSDLEREMLAEHEIEMAPTKRQAAYTEQFYLYLNMTKPQEKLYVTFSKVSEDGKALRPSYLIGVLQKLFSKLTIDEDEESEELEQIISNDRGLDYLIDGLRRFPYEDVSDTWKELFRYYNSREEYQQTIHNLIDAVFYVNTDMGLSKRIAKELYGSNLMGSVTRFEQFAACAFAHYISFGLELRERQEYRLAVPDMGNIFHNAIEGFSRKLSASEYNWHTIPDDIRDAWSEECVREAAEGYGNAILTSSKRLEYIIKRVERITKRTLWALCQQIKKGDFEPAAFELFFSDQNQLNSLTLDLSGEERIRLQGRIDRLDIYEEKDKLMVKVIDYKSGNTTFDLLSVYYGLQLQLAIYLNAAMELLERENPDKEVIPGAILYYNIDDPIVEKSDYVEASILKELKMNGIVNSNTEVVKHLDHSFKSEDGGIMPSVKSDTIPVESNKEGLFTKRSSVAELAQLKSMEDFVKETVSRFGRKILDGDTGIKPYRMGKRTACDYCPYNSICGFDIRIEGNSYRNLHSLSKEDIWEGMVERRNRNGGNEVDRGTEESN